MCRADRNPGASITSTQAAVDAGRNSYYAAGGTTYADIANTANFSGNGYSVGLGTQGGSFCIGDVNGRQAP